MGASIPALVVAHSAAEPMCQTLDVVGKTGKVPENTAFDSDLSGRSLHLVLRTSWR